MRNLESYVDGLSDIRNLDAGRVQTSNDYNEEIKFDVCEYYDCTIDK